MTWSVIFQILGSLCVFAGYWLNSKNHPRQHQLFIFGHIFLIIFTILEFKAVLFFLSLFIIIMQYKISKRKYKFKKDIVRVKKITKSIKIKKDENQRVSQKKHATRGNKPKESHVVQSGQR